MELENATWGNQLYANLGLARDLSARVGLETELMSSFTTADLGDPSVTPFETAKAVIKSESFGLLDEVAEVIVDHPELLKVRVEGHTDTRGSAAYNKGLSQARAESVVDYLTDRGVAPERLEAVGYGEDRPLVKERSEIDRAQNRRVESYVVERAGQTEVGVIERKLPPLGLPQNGPTLGTMR